MNIAPNHAVSIPATKGLRMGAYLELIRARIAVLVLAATTLGFLLAVSATGATWSGLTLMHTLLGIALIAAGANTLNQVIEFRLDRQMERTRNRPIPSGRISRGTALLFGMCVGVGGVAYLTLLVNPVAGLLGAITLLGYVLIYTPMKRITWYSVFIGAVPGAFPPVIGWTAACGEPTFDAWLLFAIGFVWQLPHFAAIAWMHRDDYGRARFPMLSVLDPSGTRVSRHLIRTSWVLLIVSLLPVVFGFSGLSYAIGATLLGIGLLWFGVHFAKSRSVSSARRHLQATIVYLPSLFTMMLVDTLL